MMLGSMMLLAISCRNDVQDTAESQSPVVLQQKNPATVYNKAGTIRIRDNRASMAGYKAPEDAFFDLALDDVGKYTGHVCAGITSAFIMTKKALAQLYPNGEIPVRGEIRVAVSAPTDHLEVVSYITGIRAEEEKDATKGPDLVVDPSLQGEEGTVAMVFIRKDNGKMVKTTFNKKKLFGPEKIAQTTTLKEKILKGKASKQEQELFAETVQAIVKKLIENPPEGAISVSETVSYRFPEN